MVDRAIIETVQRYLQEVAQAGILVERGILFGSCARGRTRPESDIDVLVVSPLFDGRKKPSDLDKLWHAARRVDSRIEPVGIGVRQYEEQAWQPLLMVARREGVSVYPAGVPAAPIAADAPGEYRPRRQPRSTKKSTLTMNKRGMGS
jgi:hypothetical protein